jgi:SAM-dependent methyltransferase
MGHIRSLTKVIPQPVRFGLRKLAFAGAGVHCPLCGNSARKFHSHGLDFEVLTRRQVVGGMRRDNDRCPICHACDRTRLMMHYLETVVGVGTKPVSILHVAPDFGLYLWLKRQQGVTYTGSDIDAARYRHISNIVTADLTKAPFADQSFDVVVCSHVMEHIPDDRKAMAEVLRILKPGGHALLLTPLAIDGLGTQEDITLNNPAEQERRFGQWDHLRIYGKDDYLARLNAAGFDASYFDPIKTNPEIGAHLMLNPLEALPIGRRPV